MISRRRLFEVFAAIVAAPFIPSAFPVPDRSVGKSAVLAMGYGRDLQENVLDLRWTPLAPVVKLTPRQYRGLRDADMIDYLWFDGNGLAEMPAGEQYRFLGRHCLLCGRLIDRGSWV